MFLIGNPSPILFKNSIFNFGKNDIEYSDFNQNDNKNRKHNKRNKKAKYNRIMFIVIVYKI